MLSTVLETKLNLLKYHCRQQPEHIYDRTVNSGAATFIQCFVMEKSGDLKLD